MESANTYVTLNNGVKVAQLGFGTWQATGSTVRAAVEAALTAGYRHIDTATLYQNETDVGAAIKAKILDGTVRRQDVFITTKLWANRLQSDQVRPSVLQSLADLGLGYIDLYLIHQPFGYKVGDYLVPTGEDGNILMTDDDYMDAYKVLEELVDEGVIKSIGVSNFNTAQLTRVLDNGRIKPVMNQIETHPFLANTRLIKFCQGRGVQVTAYCPLANCSESPRLPSLIKMPTMINIGKKYGKSPAQVAIRYAMDRGLLVIPKSITPSRIQANFEVFDFKLTEEDLAAIGKLNANERIYVDKRWFGHSNFPFSEPL